MSINARLDDLEDLISNIRAKYEDECQDVLKETTDLTDQIEVLQEQNNLLEDQVNDLQIENKYLESKVAQLEMELVEAVVKNKIV